MGATAPQRCELFVNYFVVYLTGRSSLRVRGIFYGEKEKEEFEPFKASVRWTLA